MSSARQGNLNYSMLIVFYKSMNTMVIGGAVYGNVRTGCVIICAMEGTFVFVGVGGVVSA